MPEDQMSIPWKMNRRAGGHGPRRDVGREDKKLEEDEGEETERAGEC